MVNRETESECSGAVAVDTDPRVPNIETSTDDALSKRLTIYQLSG
jgi:hypothetical protein